MKKGLVIDTSVLCVWMITEVAFWDIAEKPCLVNGYFMEKTEFDD